MTKELPKSSRRALGYIRFCPGITRHELADELGVSVTTVNPVVARLMDAGVVVEDIPHRSERSGVGRPRAGLRTPGRKESIATLIWSHGVLDQAVTTFDNQILHRHRVPIQGIPTAEEFVAAAKDLMSNAAKTATIGLPRMLMLGLPAPYERGVGITHEASTGQQAGYSAWFEEDPRNFLSAAIDIPVAAENDANLGALGETAEGAAKGASVAIYVKLSGSGIGCGLTLDGRLFSGAHGFAGELAHVRVDDQSRIICSCGSRGCLEEKIGPNMLRQLHANYGSEITYAGLLDMVDGGLPGPARLLEDAGRVAGRALADACTFFNPDVVVLDAGSRSASEVLLRGVDEQITLSAPPFIRRGICTVPATLGNDAPIIGAVRYGRSLILKDGLKPGSRWN